MMKRFGSTPEQGKMYRTRPGAYAVLAKNGRILLTFQEAPYSEFQLPGGGIDAGESTIPALRREVMEETGWSIGAPRRLGAHRRFVFLPDYDFWAEKICHVYFARPALKLSEPTEEGHHCHWVSPEKAIDLIANPGDQHFMKLALRSMI